jgi:hypothetical protein
MRFPACLSAVTISALFLVPAFAQNDNAYDHALYPLKVGNRWIYRSGNPPQQVMIEVEKREPIKVQVEASGKTSKTTIATYLLKITSGDKVMTEQVGILPQGRYSLGANKESVTLDAGVYRFQTAGKDLHPPVCFLKLPLTKGQTWEVQAESEGVTMKGTFTGGEESVKVPAGAFQTVTVTTKDLQIGTTPMAMEAWYAPQVGLVKQRVQVGSNFQTTLELEKFEPAK